MRWIIWRSHWRVVGSEFWAAINRLCATGGKKLEKRVFIWRCSFQVGWPRVLRMTANSNKFWPWGVREFQWIRESNGPGRFAIEYITQNPKKEIFTNEAQPPNTFVTRNGLKQKFWIGIGVGMAKMHIDGSWTNGGTIFFFLRSFFLAEGLFWMTVLLGSLQAAPFLYRRLRMCMKGWAKSKPQLLRGGLGDGW